MDGHHFDYSLPLQVTWLCETCHAGFHARHTAKRRAYRPTPRPIWLPDPGTADTLKAIRTRKDWTQAEMALAVGCGLRTYLRYEAGTRVPPATIWLKACALDATTEAHM
jgi:DNA-binding XRE family transcriptional regulator